MNDDLDFLVQETLNFASQMGERQNPFALSEVYPTAPGLIYRLEKGASTFVVRILEASNIDETMKLVKSSENLKKLLRVGEQDIMAIQYFETPSLELAQVIKDRIANKRFPIEEQTLCNLSDPGFSWWITHSQNSFNISFKNYRLDDLGGYQSIGALGDSRISSMKLNSCQAFLRELFPLGHFFCNENLFGAETSSTNTMAFEKFKRLFMEGRDPEELFDLDHLKEKHQSAITFLREISFVRKFWRVIEAELKLD